MCHRPRFRRTSADRRGAERCQATTRKTLRSNALDELEYGYLPPGDQAYLYVIVARTYTKNLDEGAKHFEQALTLAENNPELREVQLICIRALALYYDKAKQGEKSLELMRRILKNPELRLAIGEELLNELESRAKQIAGSVKGFLNRAADRIADASSDAAYSLSSTLYALSDRLARLSGLLARSADDGRDD